MAILESLRVALRALIANKMRSALTMLGIIIGVVAVILLVAIGSGVREEVTGSIEGIGSNLLFVLPGKVDSGSMQGTSVNKLRTEHVERLTTESENIDGAVPLIEGGGTSRFGNRTLSSPVIGASADYFSVRGWEPAAGRFFGEGDIAGGRRVAVLGWTSYEELFDGRTAIGRRVSISGQPFTVIGVTKPKGAVMGQDWDKAAMIPISTAKQMFGTENVTYILVKAKDSESVGQAKADTKRILGRNLRSEDFSVIGQDEASGTLDSILGTLTVMVAGLAGISLLVGGVGIMNIMLVSVTERTREIGIRKAVGAKVSSIMTQFVVEAVVLSMTGGAVGILVGVGGAAAISRWLPTAVAPWSIALAFGVSMCVGVFFGVYPAFKAARLEPIEALRYE